MNAVLPASCEAGADRAPTGRWAGADRARITCQYRSFRQARRQVGSVRFEHPFGTHTPPVLYISGGGQKAERACFSPGVCSAPREQGGGGEPACSGVGPRPPPCAPMRIRASRRVRCQRGCGRPRGHASPSALTLEPHSAHSTPALRHKHPLCPAPRLHSRRRGG